jgi:sporulation protein YlmC with PRC-barrel domain
MRTIAAPLALMLGLTLAGAPARAVAQAPGAPAATPPQSVGPPTPTAGPEDLADPGVWRVSDLLKQEVYQPNARKVGKVQDVILSRDGRLEGLVIDLGGLPGSRRSLAVRREAFQIVPAKATATSGTVGGLPPSTETGASARAGMQINNIVAPAGIVLNVPEADLRSAPPFESGRCATKATTPQGPAGPSGAAAPQR